MTKRERMYALGAGATRLEVPADVPSVAVSERPSAAIQPIAGASGSSRSTLQSGVMPRGPVEVSSLADDFRDGAMPEYLRDRRTWKDWWPYGALVLVALLWGGLIYVDPPIAPKKSPGSLANLAAERGDVGDIPLVADVAPEADPDQPAAVAVDEHAGHDATVSARDKVPANSGETSLKPSVAVPPPPPPPSAVAAAGKRPVASGEAPRNSPVEVSLGTEDPLPSPSGDTVASASPARPIPDDEVDLRDRPVTGSADSTTDSTKSVASATPRHLSSLRHQ